MLFCVRASTEIVINIGDTSLEENVADPTMLTKSVVSEDDQGNQENYVNIVSGLSEVAGSGTVLISFTH